MIYNCPVNFINREKQLHILGPQWLRDQNYLVHTCRVTCCVDQRPYLQVSGIHGKNKRQKQL